MAAPRPARRWLRFSLASLLAAVSLFSIWLGVKANRAQHQAHAVEKILQLGGTVAYDYEYDGSKHPHYPQWFRNLVPHDYLATVGTVRMPKSRVTDEDLQFLADLPEVVLLDLENTPISDAGLRHVRGLAKLQTLILNGTDCTDAGLKSLESLSEIGLLGLNHTRITDDGLASVRSFPKLMCLFLSGTQISDAGLAHLQGMPALMFLEFSGTQVTEEGLAALGQLPALEILLVSQNVLTEAGIGRLQALPKLKNLSFEDTDSWQITHRRLKQAMPGLQASPYTPPGPRATK